MGEAGVGRGVESGGTPPTSGDPEGRLRGGEKRQFLRDLAEGTMTGKQLAEKYGRSVSWISTCRRRYAAEINALKANIENQLFNLWVAEKANRIAEYQDDVQALAASDELDKDLLRVKHAALRSVAEEMGHLRVGVDVNAQVSWVVEPSDLRDLT